MKLSSIITGFVALMSVAQASVIQEQESNNDIGSAQVIPVGAFTLGYNPIIANSATLPWVTIEGTGDGSYDYFSFEVRAGMIASIFDIDDPTSFNSFLTLYDSSGTQLAQNNNNRPPDDGSSRRRDAYLTYTFNTAGIYTIAVSRRRNGSNQVIPNSATYTLHISLGYTEAQLRAAYGMGDPHFKTWVNEWYDFHGECDLIFISSPEFDEGTGLDIHIRTKARNQYSYIESAAVRIGEDTLEVGEYGAYMVNGISNAELDTFDKYSIKHEKKSSKQDMFVIELGRGKQIVLQSFKDLLSIKTVGASPLEYENSKGLLGDYKTGKWLARNGTALTDANAFGNEWQVLESEPKLFQSNRFPQHPVTCNVPSLKQVGRRLGESIAQTAAEKVCEHWGDQKDHCVYDVMAAGDLELAEAGAF